MHPLVVNIRSARCEVYVGRPSAWGNPFSHLPDTLAEFRVSCREEAIFEYGQWLKTHPELIERARKELKNKILGCWCAPAPCHAEILAAIANQD